MVLRQPVQTAMHTLTVGANEWEVYVCPADLAVMRVLQALDLFEGDSIERF